MSVTTGLSLADVSPKDAHLQDNKSLNQSISRFYLNSQYSDYSIRLNNCANYLAFSSWIHDTTGELSLKLKTIHTCKVRHCPVCSWARSRVWRARLGDGIPKMMLDHPTTRFIFLTLTVPNCHIRELKDTLQGMSHAWHKLMKRRELKKHILGYVRSMENTRNPDTGYAHPHYHALLALKPSYYSRGYISQAAWVELWKESLGTIEDRIVHVKAVKPNPKHLNDPFGLTSSVLEVCKYCVKHTDMIQDRDWLIEMTTQLNATKHIVLGGLIKKYVNSKDINEEDILQACEEEADDLTQSDDRHFLWQKYKKQYLELVQNG